MAFKKKIQKNRNVAELPRFESPDVAFQNFPAATLRCQLLLAFFYHACV